MTDLKAKWMPVAIRYKWWILLASLVTGAIAVGVHFGERALFNGLREEGAFYLFALRMVPVFPFWLVNLLMGLTAMRAFTFWWVSALGLLPLEAAYVFAGTQLATITKPGDIVSPGLIAVLLGLALLPLLLRRVVRWMERRYFKHE